MAKQVYVIERTVTTEVWSYNGEVVSRETIYHICDSTRIGSGTPARFPGVAVKIVEQQVLTSVYSYTDPYRAEFDKEEDGFAYFTRHSGDGDPWGYSWKFPVKKRVGNLVVIEETAGDYRYRYWGNDPKALEVDRPWKPVDPSCPLRGLEGWARWP